MKIINNATLLILITLILPVFAGGQTLISFKMDTTGKPRISIQIDSTKLSNCPPAPARPGMKVPRRTILMEYGDGQFTTTPDTNHVFYYNRNSTCWLMLVKATGIYDQGGKPPKHTARAIPESWAGNEIMRGNIVLGNAEESVHITPNVFDVLPGDTMIIVVTYRRLNPSIRGPYHLIFFYNKNKSDVFEHVQPLRTYRVMDNDGLFVNVPYARTHNGEIWTDTGSLGAETRSAYRGRFDSSKYLVLSIPQINDDEEHHFFLTMVPRHDLNTSQNLPIGMDAVLIPPGGAAPKAYNFESRLSSDLASHDPNWQNVNPKCIKLPKANQEMTHHIHFQNTGAGPARSVKVKTSLPSGLTGNDIQVTGWSIGGVRYNKNYTMNVNRSSADSIVFEFVYDPANTGKVLFGAAELPDAPVNTKTMGDIFFTCRAKPGMPNIITSGTAIYFDANEAVKTEPATVTFKKCCDCDKNKKYKSRLLNWLLCKDC